MNSQYQASNINVTLSSWIPYFYIQICFLLNINNQNIHETSISHSSHQFLYFQNKYNIITIKYPILILLINSIILHHCYCLRINTAFHYISIIKNILSLSLPSFCVLICRLTQMRTSNRILVITNIFINHCSDIAMWKWSFNDLVAFLERNWMCYQKSLKNWTCYLVINTFYWTSNTPFYQSPIIYGQNYN